MRNEQHPPYAICSRRLPPLWHLMQNHRGDSIVVPHQTPSSSQVQLHVLGTTIWMKTRKNAQAHHTAPSETPLNKKTVQAQLQRRCPPTGACNPVSAVWISAAGRLAPLSRRAAIFPECERQGKQVPRPPTDNEGTSQGTNGANPSVTASSPDNAETGTDHDMVSSSALGLLLVIMMEQIITNDTTLHFART